MAVHEVDHTVVIERVRVQRRNQRFIRVAAHVDQVVARNGDGSGIDEAVAVLAVGAQVDRGVGHVDVAADFVVDEVVARTEVRSLDRIPGAVVVEVIVVIAGLDRAVDGAVVDQGGHRVGAGVNRDPRTIAQGGDLAGVGQRVVAVGIHRHGGGRGVITVGRGGDFTAIFVVDDGAVGSDHVGAGRHCNFAIGPGVDTAAVMQFRQGVEASGQAAGRIRQPAFGTGIGTDRTCVRGGGGEGCKHHRPVGISHASVGAGISDDLSAFLVVEHGFTGPHGVVATVVVAAQIFTHRSEVVAAHREGKALIGVGFRKDVARVGGAVSKSCPTRTRRRPKPRPCRRRHRLRYCRC